jgi:hypothetical protein
MKVHHLTSCTPVYALEIDGYTATIDDTVERVTLPTYEALEVAKVVLTLQPNPGYVTRHDIVGSTKDISVEIGPGDTVTLITYTPWVGGKCIKLDLLDWVSLASTIVNHIEG